MIIKYTFLIFAVIEISWTVVNLEKWTEFQSNLVSAFLRCSKILKNNEYIYKKLCIYILTLQDKTPQL